MATALGPAGEATLSQATLVRYGLTSALVAGLVAMGSAVLGTAAAVLVALYRFPGRGLFSVLMVLPLAVPAFALAYGYADLLDVAGPVRSWARETFGLDLPLGVRNPWGAGLILSLAFYPYVYLTVRAALANQSAPLVEAARTLGRGPASAFMSVTLPLVRPALAAGMALAVMEALADYGAVSFLSVQTLTTGVVRAWSIFGSTAEAARLALPLILAAAVLIVIERSSRRGQISQGGQSGQWRPVARRPLSGWAAAGAVAFCTSLVGLALVVPLGRLVYKAALVEPDGPRLIEAAANSLVLGLIGAVVTTVLALFLALGGRRVPVLTRLVGLGYATPGAVMAVGLLVPAGYVWRGIEGAAQGFGAGLILLVLAYAARLMAAALEPLDAGLARLTPSLRGTARLLGLGPTASALRVEVPLISASLLSAGLLVLIDVIKELPATVILRPFGFDTLAVIASYYARDERLGQAAWPSLMIVALALPVALWLNRHLDRARPGAAQGAP